MNKNTKTMKLLLIVIMMVVLLYSCTEAGTLVRVDVDDNAPIEVYKYFYAKGECLYVARFKDDTTVVSTTWSEFNAATKITETKCTIVVEQ